MERNYTKVFTFVLVNLGETFIKKNSFDQMFTAIKIPKMFDDRIFLF